MAWCAASRTIDDVPHGGRFDVQGRYVSGPGRTDLGSYVIEVEESGTSLAVLSYVEPTVRSETVHPGMTGDCVDGGYEIHPFYED
jgi:hypothetical protein